MRDFGTALLPCPLLTGCVGDGGFGVMGTVRSYLRMVSCSGHRPHETTIEYGTAVAAEEDVDLGSIYFESAADEA
jgi:hypothetical protein